MSFDRQQFAAAAGVDPWRLHAQVAADDPDQIEELASAFYRAAGHTADAHASDAKAKQYVRAGYHVNGGSPLDYSAEAQRTSASIQHATVKLPRIAKLLVAVAQDLASARKGADTDVAALNTALTRIEASYQHFMSTVGHHLPPDDQESARSGFLTDAINAVRTHGNSVGTIIDGYERSLAAASKSMADLGYVAPDGLHEAAEQLPPPVGSDPTKVASWWKGLTPAEQKYLVEHNYDTLGQLQGLPAPILNTANHHRLTDHISQERAALAALNANPSNDPYGVQRATLRDKLKQDLGIQHALTPPGPGGPPVFLLRYDPIGREGQTGAEISFGNPDTATDTAVVVPGTGNNVGKLRSLGKSSLDLYNQMTSSHKAVVTWLDGPEPQSAVTQAGFDYWANESAPNLKDDLAGLHAAHSAAAGGNPGHLTAIGHSYGSYILGKALSEGAKVDDTIFIGSPGVGVNHARDLGMNPSHVWDGQAGDDPILWVDKRFTPDPLSGNNPEESGFGAQHFSVAGSHGHSEYYQGESLKNMARIADCYPGSVDKVSAPDYRGIRELPQDALDGTVLDPLYTTEHTAKDLLTGHPLDAAGDLWDGSVKQGKDLWHTTEDVFGAIGDLL